jgi:hydroxylamine reductase (hybrid-cluster protein)
MSGYGGKEKWILPMGTLSAEYEDRFTTFIDEICDTSGCTGPRQQPQYSGPSAVKSRLDPLSQEGIPTLPFLIDQPREFAGLVKLWNRQCLPTSTNQAHHAIDITKLSDAARAFHTACVQLNLKTVSLVETAVERDEEELSESDVVDEDIVVGVAEMSVQNHSGPTRFVKKEVYRKASFTHDDGDDGVNPSKRALDSVWPGFLRKRGSEREKI